MSRHGQTDVAPACSFMSDARAHLLASKSLDSTNVIRLASKPKFSWVKVTSWTVVSPGSTTSKHASDMAPNKSLGSIDQGTTSTGFLICKKAEEPVTLYQIEFSKYIFSRIDYHVQYSQCLFFPILRWHEHDTIKIIGASRTMHQRSGQGFREAAPFKFIRLVICHDSTGADSE